MYNFMMVEYDFTQYYRRLTNDMVEICHYIWEASSATQSHDEKAPIIYVNFTQNYTYLLILSFVIILYQHKNINYLHKVWF